MGRAEVPVAVGRPTPVPPTRIDHQFSWAEDFASKEPVSTPAARFIVEAVRKAPGELTIVAVGPLQNLADALRLDPSIANIVPVDATSRIKLSDEERERVRKRRTPLANALEALYRLWIDSPESRMTLHDQLAVAETMRPGQFFERSEILRLVVDDEGFTRVDAENGKPIRVMFEARRDAVVDYYLRGLTDP